VLGKLARIPAPILLAASLLVTGCGGDSNSTQSSTTRTARKQPVPASLGSVESSAEDIVDFAQQGRRDKIVAAALELRQAAEGRAADDLEEAGVAPARIVALQDRARRVGDRARRARLIQVSLAANQVSALMPGLYAHYSDPVPPDVLRLDYLDREAQLRSQAGDRAPSRKAVQDLDGTWSGLRPQVLEAGGESVAVAFSRHVAAMRELARGSDERSFRAEAVKGLELVDRLEQAFRSGEGQQPESGEEPEEG
jgi:hypothetical protein